MPEVATAFAGLQVSNHENWPIGAVDNPRQHVTDNSVDERRFGLAHDDEVCSVRRR
jgi:hypothetical protein